MMTTRRGITTPMMIHMLVFSASGWEDASFSTALNKQIKVMLQQRRKESKAYQMLSVRNFHSNFSWFIIKLILWEKNCKRTKPIKETNSRGALIRPLFLVGILNENFLTVNRETCNVNINISKHMKHTLRGFTFLLQPWAYRSSSLDIKVKQKINWVLYKWVVLVFHYIEFKPHNQRLSFAKLHLNDESYDRI